MVQTDNRYSKITSRHIPHLQKYKLPYLARVAQCVANEYPVWQECGYILTDRAIPHSASSHTCCPVLSARLSTFILFHTIPVAAFQQFNSKSKGTLSSSSKNDTSCQHAHAACPTPFSQLLPHTLQLALSIETSMLEMTGNIPNILANPP